LHYGSGGATTETVGAAVTSKTFSGIATSGVFSVQANINYGSTTWTSVASNAKNYTVVLVAVGICTSA
jgi:RNase H-fold protein (predicted Holliday junction resolvase)